MNFVEKSGDLWEEARTDKLITVITTNGAIKNDGKAVMGAGIAKQAKNSVKGIDKRLGILLEQYGNRPFRLAEGAWSLPVKHFWRDKADPALIQRSLDSLVEMIEKFSPEVVRLPRPGCGNGSLSWEKDGIKDMVNEFAGKVDCQIEVWHYR